MQTQRKHPRIKLYDIFAAIGVVSTGLALLYPAVQAFAWGLRNPQLALILLVLAGLGLLSILAFRTPQQPESREP